MNFFVNLIVTTSAPSLFLRQTSQRQELIMPTGDRFLNFYAKKESEAVSKHSIEAIEVSPGILPICRRNFPTTVVTSRKEICYLLHFLATSRWTVSSN